MIVAIEGADGAGKNTAARGLAGALNARGMNATVISFPQYGKTVGATALGEFLAGRLLVPVTPESLAVLYALDRFESCDLIRTAAESHDVVVFDRYVASNVVYQGAKVDPAGRMAFMRWIVELELHTFRLPPPSLNIYLDTPVDAASKLMHLKDKRSYTDRRFDEHEADAVLQTQVREVYAMIAAENLLGPWYTVRTVNEGHLRPPGEIQAEILDQVLSAFIPS